MIENNLYWIKQHLITNPDKCYITILEYFILSLLSVVYLKGIQEGQCVFRHE